MEEHLSGMEKADMIEETTEDSMWNSRVFCVPKPGQPGNLRFVADFLALNAQCLLCSYTIANINHVANNIGGAKWFSKFDLCSPSFRSIMTMNPWVWSRAKPKTGRRSEDLGLLLQEGARP